MRRISVVVLALGLLSALVLTTPVPASGPPATLSSALPLPELDHASLWQESDGAPALLAVTSPVTGTVSTFLPLVTRNYRSGPSCSADSPFGIAIAAIHQIQPDGLLSRALVADGLLLKALEESGACWAHVGINWSTVQPEAPVDGQPPVYDWAWFDQKFALVAGTGLRLYVVVEFVPEWARGEPYPDLACTHVREDRLDEFAQFLTDMVNRYKEPPWNVHHWELRNEPDGTAGELVAIGQGCGGFRGDLYAQMLSVAYPAIKAADPMAVVLMGGVAHDWFTENYPVSPPDGKFYRYFADDVMANGGAPYLDAINFHYFHDFAAEWERWDPNSEERQKGWLPAPTCGDLFDGRGLEYEAGGIDLIAKLTHFRNRLSTCYGVYKPVWLSELAEHGYPGYADSLAQQARYVIQGHVRGLAIGAQNITWFALVSPPYDSGEQGLLYQDFTPKPAYIAYQTLTAELANWDYSHTLAVPNVEGYVFRNAGQQEKTVAWVHQDATQPAFLTFAAASSLYVVDRDGNGTYIQDGGAGDADGALNGSIQIQLPAAPAEPLFISR